MLWYCPKEKELFRERHEGSSRIMEEFIFSEQEFCPTGVYANRYDALGIAIPHAAPTAYARQITIEEIYENPQLWSSDYEYRLVMTGLI